LKKLKGHPFRNFSLNIRLKTLYQGFTVVIAIFDFVKIANKYK
jgi:hypothetical protein